MWDLVAWVERGQLIRVKPGGVAFNSSELVDEEVIQVSVRAKRSCVMSFHIMIPGEVLHIYCKLGL